MDLKGVVYPYEDDIGFIWVDSNTFLADREEPCFICKTPTKRLDVNYHGHYCGSAGCEQAIMEELRAMDNSAEEL